MNLATSASLRLSAFSSCKNSFAVCRDLSPFKTFSAKASRFSEEVLLRKLFSTTTRSGVQSDGEHAFSLSFPSVTSVF
ncbi:hypothetical protein FDW87_03075 [Citrobacter sp. wls826]|nr:hypothetical protein FDW87_03075 [Citrobacter sp. wls826]TKV32998.1 hypothetical protein FDX20_14750 [Citrobacter sp. TBCS-11]